MAHQKIDNLSLINALLDVFRLYGYEGATLSRLSKATGLKKSSLYHRYPEGKDDIVSAIVNHVSEQFQEYIIEPLLNNKVKPDKRFGQMICSINEYYDNGKKNCILNVLNLGEISLDVKEKLKHDYQNWLSVLIKLGEEAGMSNEEATLKSKHFLIAVEGSLVIQRITNDVDTFKESMEYQKNCFLSFNDD